jgi:large subunit ribosomal protein L5
MQKIRIEKVTLNIGAGKEQRKLEKGIKLITQITGIEPVKTITNKRIPGFGLRPGLPIGCKVTLRGEGAKDVLKRLLEAKDNILKEANFDDKGNISFGVHEYIDIPGAKYDPEIGVMGLQASVTLERPGYRIKKRVHLKKRLPKKVIISREESIGFMKENFNIKVGEDE